LFYGAFKGRQARRNVSLIDALQFRVLALDKEDARQAGELRSFLANGGTPIGPYDVLIAGQAVVRKLILVTHNTKEFARVPGLRIEDWQA
jgi:tRNA(fMet)-specific endonuclease VapC